MSAAKKPEPTDTHKTWCEYKTAEDTVLRGMPDQPTYDMVSQMAVPELVQRVLHGRAGKGDVAEAALLSIADEADEIAWALSSKFDVRDVDPNLLEYIANRLGDLKDRAEAAAELHKRIREPWGQKQPPKPSVIVPNASVEDCDDALLPCNAMSGKGERWES